MGADQHLDWMSSAASALDWWQEAGVDVLVEDAPRDWLAEPMAAPVAFTALLPAVPVHKAGGATRHLGRFHRMAAGRWDDTSFLLPLQL